MAIAESASPPIAARGGRQVEQAPSTAKPVKYWAIVGAATMLFQVYVYGRWIASDSFRRIEPGPDATEGLIEAGRIIFQTTGPVAMLFVLYWFVLRPRWRDGHMSLDGLLILVALASIWQDPLVNYTQIFANYNSAYLNMGGWAEFIPGWMAPNGSNYPEPALQILTMYGVAMWGGLVLANKVMTAVKDRRPHTDTLGLVAACYAFFLVAQTALEAGFLRLGLYVYPGSHEHLSFFGGNYYQFPVYEALLWSGAWTGMACMRYFRDDKGHTAAERGLDDLGITGAKKTGVRFLALLGMFTAYFMAYNVAFAWISLNQSDWPTDITSRSYFVSEMCSPPDERACPGPDIPVPRPDSGYVGSDGKYVAPG